MRLIAGAPGAAAGLLASWWNASVSDAQCPGCVRVLSWNVLARAFTKHNRQLHLADGMLEEPSQTRSRYSIAGEEIARLAADLVFLQECEAEFFSSEWNSAAPNLLAGYEIFRCPRNPTLVGTAVLVKRGGAVEALDRTPFCVGGSSETGGRSKVATMVEVRVGRARFAAISTHFTWDGLAKKRLLHAQLLAQAVGTQSAIIAGDFNCEPGRGLRRLEETTMFGALRHLELQPGAMTGFTGDFSAEVCIDHAYVSAELGAARAAALARPRAPWSAAGAGPARVVGASDHIPIGIELDLRQRPGDGCS